MAEPHEPRWRPGNATLIWESGPGSVRSDVWLERGPGHQPVRFLLVWGPTEYHVMVVSPHEHLRMDVRWVWRAVGEVVRRWHAHDPDPLIQDAGPHCALLLLGHPEPPE